MITGQHLIPSDPITFQNECLNLVAGTLNINSAVAYFVDEQAKAMCYQTYQMQPSMHRDYMQSFYKLDPLHPSHFCDNADAQVVKMNDLVPLSQRREHPYFTGFIDAWDVQDIVELFFRVDNKLVAGMGLLLNKQQPELLSADIKRLESLHRFVQFSLEQSLQSPRQLQFDQFCQQYNLTPKERMVVELVTQGLPNKSIAISLCCGLATVKTHLQHIFYKLGVNSKAEVASLLYMANKH